MSGLSDECRYDFAQWICGGVHGEEFQSACDSCWRVAEYVESEFLSRLLTEAEERGAAKVRERVEAALAAEPAWVAESPIVQRIVAASMPEANSAGGESDE